MTGEKKSLLRLSRPWRMIGFMHRKRSANFSEISPPFSLHGNRGLRIHLSWHHRLSFSGARRSTLGSINLSCDVETHDIRRRCGFPVSGIIPLLLFQSHFDGHAPSDSWQGSRLKILSVWAVTPQGRGGREPINFHLVCYGG